MRWGLPSEGLCLSSVFWTPIPKIIFFSCFLQNWSGLGNTIVAHTCTFFIYVHVWNICKYICITCHIYIYIHGNTDENIMTFLGLAKMWITGGGVNGDLPCSPRGCWRGLLQVISSQASPGPEGLASPGPEAYYKWFQVRIVSDFKSWFLAFSSPETD